MVRKESKRAVSHYLVLHAYLSPGDVPSWLALQLSSAGQACAPSDPRPPKRLKREAAPHKDDGEEADAARAAAHCAATCVLQRLQSMLEQLGGALWSGAAAYAVEDACWAPRRNCSLSSSLAESPPPARSYLRLVVRSPALKAGNCHTASPLLTLCRAAAVLVDHVFVPAQRRTTPADEEAEWMRVPLQLRRPYSCPVRVERKKKTNYTTAGSPHILFANAIARPTLCISTTKRRSLNDTHTLALFIPSLFILSPSPFCSVPPRLPVSLFSNFLVLQHSCWFLSASRKLKETNIVRVAEQVLVLSPAQHSHPSIHPSIESIDLTPLFHSGQGESRTTASVHSERRKLTQRSQKEKRKRGLCRTLFLSPTFYIVVVLLLLLAETSSWKIISFIHSFLYISFLYISFIPEDKYISLHYCPDSEYLPTRLHYSYYATNKQINK
eukprot:gene626-346_t